MTEDVAILSDIHGNLLALEAIERDLDAEPVGQVVCLGDVAAMGPDPNGCIEFLERKQWTVILGNTDAWLLGDLEMPETILKLSQEAMPMAREIVGWGRESLLPENRGFLEQLDGVVELRVGGETSILCCHGSPRSFQDRMLATTAPEALDTMLGEVEASVIAAGHTHIPMVRRHRDMLLVNPGSVGLPFYDRTESPNGMRLSPRAQYARLAFTATGQRIELREVPLDIVDIEAAVHETGMPHSQWWASLWPRVA